MKATVKRAFTAQEFITAVNASNNIDHLEYIGHAGLAGLESNPNPTKWQPVLFLSPDQELSIPDLQKIKTSALKREAVIYLTACNTATATISHGSMSDHFAKVFNRPVVGYQGGLNWGLQKSERVFGKRIDAFKPYGLPWTVWPPLGKFIQGP